MEREARSYAEEQLAVAHGHVSGLEAEVKRQQQALEEQQLSLAQARQHMNPSTPAR